MASSFGSYDLTKRIRRTNGSVPFWEPNDPILRRPLAYGGESVQDSGQRTMTMTLDVELPDLAAHRTLRALSGTVATFTYRGTAFPNVTMIVTGPTTVGVLGRVSCKIRLTVGSWAL